MTTPSPNWGCETVQPMGYWLVSEDTGGTPVSRVAVGLMDCLVGMVLRGSMLARRCSRASLMDLWSGLKLAKEPARKRFGLLLLLNASSYSPMSPP